MGTHLLKRNMTPLPFRMLRKSSLPIRRGHTTSYRNQYYESGWGQSGFSNLVRAHFGLAWCKQYLNSGRGRCRTVDTRFTVRIWWCVALLKRCRWGSLPRLFLLAPLNAWGNSGRCRQPPRQTGLCNRLGQLSKAVLEHLLPTSIIKTYLYEKLFAKVHYMFFVFQFSISLFVSPRYCNSRQFAFALCWPHFSLFIARAGQIIHCLVFGFSRA